MSSVEKKNSSTLNAEALARRRETLARSRAADESSPHPLSSPRKGTRKVRKLSSPQQILRAKLKKKYDMPREKVVPRPNSARPTRIASGKVLVSFLDASGKKVTKKVKDVTPEDEDTGFFGFDDQAKLSMYKLDCKMAKRRGHA